MNMVVHPTFPVGSDPIILNQLNHFCMKCSFGVFLGKNMRENKSVEMFLVKGESVSFYERVYIDNII